jgi:hypothetical protein
MAVKRAARNSLADEKIKRWRFLIYMAADNNLKEESLFALTELMRALKEGPETPIDVIVQFDSGNEIARYDFTVSNLKDNPLATLGDLKKPLYFDHLSDAELLEQFLTDNIEEASDEVYNMVVLSGHGSGAVGDFMRSDNPPDFLSIPTLGSVLQSALQKVKGRIDVIGMDSCLMSMAEVCYELRGLKSILIGAEGFAQNTGWPYHQIITSLKTEPVWEPLDVAKRIVEKYISYYSDYTAVGISVDHSACDLGEIEKLTGSVKTLALTLQLKLDDQSVRDAIVLAHLRAQSYKFEQYVDLWDFCDQLHEGCKDPEVKQACKDTKEDVENVVRSSCYSGAAVQFSRGISIYFPWKESALISEYENLEFAKDTFWLDFLKIYVRVTRRHARRDNPEAKLRQMPVISPSKPATPLAVRHGEDRHGEDRGLENWINPIKNMPNDYSDCDCLQTSYQVKPK